MQVYTVKCLGKILNHVHVVNSTKYRKGLRLPFQLPAENQALISLDNPRAIRPQGLVCSAPDRKLIIRRSERMVACNIQDTDAPFAPGYCPGMRVRDHHSGSADK